MIGYVWLVLNLIFISVTLSTAKQWITKSTNFLQRNQLKMVQKMAGLLMICTDITSKMCSGKKLFLQKKGDTEHMKERAYLGTQQTLRETLWNKFSIAI